MDWKDTLKIIGGGAYGAMKNQPNLSGLAGGFAPKIAGKTGMKIGGKGFKFGPEQANALLGILGPVVQALQSRRRR